MSFSLDFEVCISLTTSFKAFRSCLYPSKSSRGDLGLHVIDFLLAPLLDICEDGDVVIDGLGELRQPFLYCVLQGGEVPLPGILDHVDPIRGL